MTLSTGTERETSADGNTAQAVFVQDQTTEIVDLHFHNNLNAVTLAQNTVIDSSEVVLEPGHGFVAGNSLCLLEGQSFSQFSVLSVATDTLTLDTPMDAIYNTQATAIRHDFDMRVDGSSTPVIFRIEPIAGMVWDITRVIIVMESTANAMDFTGFGSLAALTNGCVLRKHNGDNKNIFNWKSNGEFINHSYDGTFQTKTGGGGSGFTSRSTFAGQGRRGVVVRLDGDEGESLQVLVQDLITAAGTLTRFEMIAQGHVVQ